jgi:large conductance mechanosensitive channel
MFEGFKKFILRGNVVDLAIGVVVGAAFSSLVQSLVKDIITPLIEIIGQVPDFSSYSFTIRNSKFTIGDFINSLLSFLIIAIVVYFFVVKPINKLISITQKQKEPNKKQCPYCLSEIPVEAKKCAYCTADLYVKRGLRR